MRSQYAISRRLQYSVFLAILFFGLPKIAAATNICGNISTSTWSTSGSPYVITCNSTVTSGSTLTINAGVTVKFNSATQLMISGKLLAVGTSASTILFTSSSGTPSAGSWRSIYFGSTSTAGSRISYATISYAGATDLAALRVDGQSPAFDHLTINYSSSSGVYVTGTASPTFDTVTVSNCSTAGITANQGTATISNSTLSSNTINGLNVITGTASITNSTISNNTDYAIGDQTGGHLTYSGLTLSGNGGGSKNAIGYRGSYLQTSERWNAGIDWVVLTSLTIGVSGHSGFLTIDAGTMVKFTTGTVIYNQGGTITAIGTSASPITFTSNASSPAAGDWRSIYFTSAAISSSRISYATISYAGATDPGALYIAGSSPQIDHLTVLNSASSGIFLDGSSPTLDTVTVSGSAGAGITTNNGTPTISNSTISNNASYGFNA
ncbi:MAG: hypothetical protein C5B54_08720, partial [Acidobacteria bacterium]